MNADEEGSSGKKEERRRKMNTCMGADGTLIKEMANIIKQGRNERLQKVLQFIYDNSLRSGFEVAGFFIELLSSAGSSLPASPFRVAVRCVSLRPGAL
jgi:hypothetical protein